MNAGYRTFQPWHKKIHSTKEPAVKGDPDEGKGANTKGGISKLFPPRPGGSRGRGSRDNGEPSWGEGSGGTTLPWIIWSFSIVQPDPPELGAPSKCGSSRDEKNTAISIIGTMYCRDTILCRNILYKKFRPVTLILIDNKLHTLFMTPSISWVASLICTPNRRLVGALPLSGRVRHSFSS